MAECVGESDQAVGMCVGVSRISVGCSQQEVVYQLYSVEGLHTRGQEVATVYKVFLLVAQIFGCLIVTVLFKWLKPTLDICQHLEGSVCVYFKCCSLYAAYENYIQHIKKQV